MKRVLIFAGMQLKKLVIVTTVISLFIGWVYLFALSLKHDLYILSAAWVLLSFIAIFGKEITERIQSEWHKAGEIEKKWSKK